MPGPRHERMLIGGEFVAAASGQTREIRDLGTGAVAAIVPEGGTADIDAAVAEYDIADAANCCEFYGGLATKIHGLEHGLAELGGQAHA